MSDSECITIQLRDGLTTTIDVADADLAKIKWYPKKADHGFYVSRGSNFSKAFLHRVVAERAIGRPIMPNEQVDHINGDKLDNRRCNLRYATAIQNQGNAKRRSDNTSGYKGVSWHSLGKKWRANIRVNKTKIHLGLFDTPEQAHEAYCEAAKKHFGDFARFE